MIEHDSHFGMLRDILSYDGDNRMSDWEVGFVEDLQSRSTEVLLALSEKQMTKIEQIWDKLFR